MKQLTLFFAMLMACSAHAQYVNDESSTDVPLKKHIIATHINPLIGVLTSNGVNNGKLGITYKRQIADNKRLRIQSNWLSGYDPSISQGEKYLLGISDSLVYEVSHHTKSNHYTFGVGMEWGNYERPIAPFYAVDLFAGLGNGSKSTTYHISRLDTVTGGFVYGISDTIFFNRYSNDTIIYLPNQNTFRTLFGISLSVGARINLGKRWELTGQLTPQLTRSGYRLREKHAISNIQYEMSYTSWDIELRLLEVMFAYKF